MVSRRVIIGLVLMVVGILIFAVGIFVTGSGSENVPPVSSGVVWELSPSFVGSGTVTISWSGGTSNTTVSLYDCGTGGCGTFSSVSGFTQVANGTGASGSFQASLTDGHTYFVDQKGSSNTISVSYSILALGYLSVIGIVLEAVGLILVVLPSRAPPAPMEEAAPMEPPSA